MCNVAGKVIGGQLILRIESLFLQIFSPFCKLRPVAFRKLRVAFRPRQRIGEDEHVPALFNRHLVLFSLFSAAVNLPIGQGILTQVMR